MNEEEKIRIWQVTATRLRELIDLKNVKQVDLIKYVNNKTGVNSLKGSTMSHYLNTKGKRSLPYEHAMLFSEYLEVLPGYLLGDDNFTCNSYAEYLQALSIIHKDDDNYFNLFNILGFGLAFDDGIAINGNEKSQTYPEYYTVSKASSDNKTPIKWTLSPDEMQKLYDHIKVYIEQYLDQNTTRVKSTISDLPMFNKEVSISENDMRSIKQFKKGTTKNTSQKATKGGEK